MGHELDITNGVASFASAREHAWHRLGQVVDDVMTAEQALANAHLAGWNVRKLPLQIPQEPVLTEYGVTTPDPIDVPDRFATVRTNPVTGSTDYLGVVGNGYTVLQNEEHCEMLNTLVDESGAHFETAGALRGGRQTFVSMKLPRHMSLRGHDGEDTTELYLVGLNSHDGSSAFRLLVTPIRVVCANTQAAALGNAKAQFSIRHTSGAKGAIAEARQALGLTFRYMEEFERQAQALIDREVTEAQATVVLKKVFKFDESATDRTKNNQEERIGKVMDLWRFADTNANIRGTAYGLYSSVTEYLDHFAPTWGNADAGLQRAERVARGTDVTRMKEQAFTLLGV